MNFSKRYWVGIASIFALCGNQAFPQPAYFIDGQHGGVYGHYPPYVTQYLVDQLNQHPDYRINLEIEPVTWDTVQTNTPEAYEAFKKLFADQSIKTARIEYVDPQYGQSFLWDIQGECIIRQLQYGMEKVRQHFPNADFSTYSAEEPMFTSALPGILKSLGFQYASLKNPNTCWGGYVRAHGGELVNWIGPDGTKILTVPRYGMESLAPGSTWQTIAADESSTYVTAAFAAGIEHPVGMCFQDAGWRFGPWLRDHKIPSHPVIYETWRDYFENVADRRLAQDWRFSQEDVLVSLVWGSQIMQHVAQNVRGAENRIFMAEKLAAISKVYTATPWPKPVFDEAWRTLLLSQHHDCWIVPYNLKNDHTWAQHVGDWTGATKQAANDVMGAAMDSLSGAKAGQNTAGVTVFNTLGTESKAVVSVTLPAAWPVGAQATVLDSNNRAVPTQLAAASGTNAPQVMFQAEVPAMGYATYTITNTAAAPGMGASVSRQPDGTYKLETDLYQVVLDPVKGGVIKSLVAKALGNQEFVDANNPRSFNEIRGYFNKDGGFHSSADNPAQISVLENGPLQLRLAIAGTIDSHPYTNVLTLAQGQSAIDLRLKINWQGNPAIGLGTDDGRDWKATNDVKAFYDDRYKLLALFPANLKAQKIYKNAPFDVLESQLTDTFFTNWSGIKNNVLLNWVDVEDGANRRGLALLTDHTTSYAHGEDFPLGLTLQYSGMGLWGRNYQIEGPTEIHYALIPHAGTWQDARIWTESDRWNQPLVTTVNSDPQPAQPARSLIDAGGTGFEISSATFQGDDLLVRVFNAEGGEQSQTILYHGKADHIQMVELDGRTSGELQTKLNAAGASQVTLKVPKFGVRTIKFTNARS